MINKIKNKLEFPKYLNETFSKFKKAKKDLFLVLGFLSLGFSSQGQINPCSSVDTTIFEANGSSPDIPAGLTTNILQIINQQVTYCIGDPITLKLTAPNHAPAIWYVNGTQIDNEGPFLSNYVLTQGGSNDFVCVGSPIGSEDELIASVIRIYIPEIDTSYITTPTCDSSIIGTSNITNFSSYCGCDSTVVDTYVYAPLDTTTASQYPEHICTGDAFRLSIIDQNYTSVKWISPEEEVFRGPSIDIDYAKTFFHTGTRTYIASNGTCEIQGNIDVTINIPPRLIPAEDVTICQYNNDEVILYPWIESERPYSSTLAKDGVTIGNNPTHTITPEETIPDANGITKAQGTYILQVVDTLGCTNTDSTYVETVFCCENYFEFNGFKIFVPNVFSPNHDGINDIFKPNFEDNFVENIDEYEFKVFDRRGEEIYSTDTIGEGRNGTYRDMALDANDFVRYIKIKTIGGECEKKYKGDVTLVK